MARLPPAILLMGPTASGKSAVAETLATRLDCEIVSVDSAQVYRHMDIGTAKPDAETRKRVPHHLIDVVAPHETYSAARFREDALTVMRDITGRGHIPLLTGGTMLYFRALTEGLSDLPKADPAIRLMIDTKASESGWPALHRELGIVDPETASRLEPNDAQRIQRALEVYYIAGEPLSALVRRPQCVDFPYAPLRIALAPSERAVLHRRIARRFEDMLQRGLIDEVRRLRARYRLEASMPSMRCVGYRQAWRHLEGEYGLAALREKAVAATRQLAKRQLTWLRAMEGVRTFDCLAGDAAEQVLDCVQRELAARSTLP